MTDQNASPDAHDEPVVPADAAASFPLPSNHHRYRGMLALLLWLVMIVTIIAVGVGDYALNRKVDRIGRHQQAADTQLLAQVSNDAHQASVQVETLKSRLANDEASQQALVQQYADLAHNRDDWMLAEVSQMLTSASEQLELTGNTKLALIALQNADARLAVSGSVQVLAVRRAIALDTDRLKAAPTIDLAGLALKLDTAIGQIDTLPLAGEAPASSRQTPKATSPDEAKATAHEPRWKAWLHQFMSDTGRQLSSLVQVRRIDNADAMLVSPGQAYFMRENLKLRLMSARLSLLSHNSVTLKADLQDADATLAHYFDNDAKSTQTVLDLVKQVQGSANTAVLPDLDNSLHALQQYQNRG